MNSPATIFPPSHWPDQNVAWHYGDPLGEQRSAAQDKAIADLSSLKVIRIEGSERGEWLNKLVSQKVDNLAAGSWTQALVLDAQGRVEHHMWVHETGDTSLWLVTEPQKVDSLVLYLSRMVFWAKVSVEYVPEHRVLAIYEKGIRRTFLCDSLEFSTTWASFRDQGYRAVGTWSTEALRVAALQARLDRDTDDRTVPHEVGWVNPRVSQFSEWKAVHLNKGCYRGQETVAKIANVGRPPRALALVHCDSESIGELLPGEALTDERGTTVGRLGTVVTHYELGTIGLALVKRSIDPALPLLAAGQSVRLDTESLTHEEEPKPGRDAIAQWRLSRSETPVVS